MCGTLSSLAVTTRITPLLKGFHLTQNSRYNTEEQKRLWEVSEKITGLKTTI
jgi:hypothetical protein